MSASAPDEPESSREIAPLGSDFRPAADPIRILFVEDDDDFREALADQLSDHGFAVQGFADGATLLSAFEAGLDADLILLDWSLPKTPGIDLVPRLRRRGITLPIVFLTGHFLPDRENKAFDRGATDFIDKARGVDVLVCRLRRIVEAAKPTSSPAEDKRFVRGKLVLRPATSRAYWNQVDVGLTLGEYNVVHLLASNVGQCVTYRAIYDGMHSKGFLAGYGADGYRVNVRSEIKRIRQKFLKIDPTFEDIQTVTSFGYRWGKSPDLVEHIRLGR